MLGASLVVFALNVLYLLLRHQQKLEICCSTCPEDEENDNCIRIDGGIDDWINDEINGITRCKKDGGGTSTRFLSMSKNKFDHQMSDASLSSPTRRHLTLRVTTYSPNPQPGTTNSFQCIRRTSAFANKRFQVSKKMGRTDGRTRGRIY